MDEASPVQDTASVEAETPVEQRWPVGVALFTAWLCPATTARQTDHARLFHVWIVHFLALTLAEFAFLACVAWSDTTSFELRPLVWAIEDLLDELILAASREPVRASLIVIGGLLAVEVAHVLLALLFMPWGAKDEPLSVSFRNSLRRTWIQSTHLLPGVLLVGSAAVTLGHLEANRNLRNPGSVGWPAMAQVPNLSPEDPEYEEALAKHLAAYAEYDRRRSAANRAHFEWLRQKPWYIREPELLSVVLGSVTGLWILWALLRSIGAPRRAPPIERPPMCTNCGYNLHTIAHDSRCPECGDSVIASLGPDAQLGAPWLARRTTGRLAAWRRTTVEAIFRPTAFGRCLRLSGADTDHRSFFALHLPAIFLVSVIGVFDTFMVIIGSSALPPGGNVLLQVLLLSAALGCVCVVGAVAVSHVAAILVGILRSLQLKRNLLPASMQMVAYLSGYLVAWAFFGAVLAATLKALPGALRQLRAVTGLVPIGQFILLFVVPNLAWGVVYLILVARGTAASRYANR